MKYSLIDAAFLFFSDIAMPECFIGKFIFSNKVEVQFDIRKRYVLYQRFYFKIAQMPVEIYLGIAIFLLIVFISFKIVEDKKETFSLNRKDRGE